MYLSVPDINLYLGTSGEDALIGVILENAEQVINTLIGGDLLQSNYIEFKEYKDVYKKTFYLNEINPTVISKIDNVSVTAGTEYVLDGNKVTLKDTPVYQETFPYKNKIEYTAGYAEVPSDIKQAVYILCGALYNSKASSGIDSFDQDLLSVTFSKTTLEKILDPNSFSLFTGIINAYRKVLIITS